MRAGGSAMVLSFSRGRARRVARELLELEFRLDLEAMKAPALRSRTGTREDTLRRDVERCLHELASLSQELDGEDVLRGAIVRACGCYDARARTGAARGSAADVSWALSLRELEHALRSRAPARARSA